MDFYILTVMLSGFKSVCFCAKLHGKCNPEFGSTYFSKFQN